MLRSIDVEDAPADEIAPPPHSTIPPPLPAKARSFRRPLTTPPEAHPERLAEVVAALSDLPFFETAVEAACFGVVVAMRSIPSLAGLALVRDEERGGYVVVYAKGPRGCEIVRSRVAEDDPVVAAALVNGGPIALEYGPDRHAPERHAIFGEPWTALIVPVQDAERCLALIELVDPLDGSAAGEAGRHALATIARHLADFARGRRLTVDRVFAPEQLGLE